MGARGLMQLMPSTAAAVARGLGIELDEDDLDDPRVNLRLGTQLLHDLLADFAGEPDELRRLELALASYNAGQGAVRAPLPTMPGASGSTPAGATRPSILSQQPCSPAASANAAIL